MSNTTSKLASDFMPNTTNIDIPDLAQSFLNDQLANIQNQITNIINDSIQQVQSLINMGSSLLDSVLDLCKPARISQAVRSLEDSVSSFNIEDMLTFMDINGRPNVVPDILESVSNLQNTFNTSGFSNPGVLVDGKVYEDYI